MSELLQVMADWSFWDGFKSTDVVRDVALPLELSPRLAFAIKGVRRGGKSTLLQQMIKFYRLDPRDCAFVNFEDPRLSNALTFQTLQALVSEFRKLRGATRPLTFFFDEIQ